MARRPGGEAEIQARIAAAPGLDEPAGHRLAGLLEAEASFGLVPNNRTGWRCVCQINLRDDDRDTLIGFRELLGIGHLATVAARRGSRPQVVWRITSKVECVVLAKLLDEHPVRGRKLKEYGIWREAVAAWTARRYGLAPRTRTRLEGLALDLKAARRYREPPPDALRPPLSDQNAAYHFAGFFSGEGSFGLAARAARFLIKLRRDDRPLLEAFQAEFGMGTVCDVAAGAESWSPAAVWHVTSARDVLNGIALLDCAGLLGRKERQFRAWRAAAEAISLAKLARLPVDTGLVAAGRRDLSTVTAYTAPSKPLVTDHGYAVTRNAHLDVLRAWAASVEGPLSCTSYQEARQLHPSWPKRDTIAFAFGGWYEALRSAGLEHRAARRPSAV